MNDQQPYPARLDIDYPDTLDRFTSFFRPIWALPIVLIGSAAYRAIRVRRAAPRRPGPSDGGVIDGEYRVVGAAEAGGTGQSKTHAPEDGAAEAAMGRV